MVPHKYTAMKLNGGYIVQMLASLNIKSQPYALAISMNFCLNMMDSKTVHMKSFLNYLEWYSQLCDIFEGQSSLFV